MMTKEQSWNHAFGLINLADNREDIPVAELAMKAHLAKYPEDDIGDPWHTWSRTVAAINQRHEQAISLGLDADEEARRDDLLRSSHSNGDFLSNPGVIDEMQNASDALAQWLIEHPEDDYAAERHAALTRNKQYSEELLAQFSEEEIAAEREAT